MSKAKKDITTITQEYYDSQDADEFYHTIWGGEDIHIGIYNDRHQSIVSASARTVQKMLEKLNHISADSKILDLGSGYGGAARTMAKQVGCHVTCLNLSTVENERNRIKNKEQGLSEFIEVVQGNFETLPFTQNSFDIVWSQDAILHSQQKSSVFKEIERVLRKNGQFIMTDPMHADQCPQEVLAPILKRIHLNSMGSVALYKQLATKYNFKVQDTTEMPDQLITHYSKIYKKLINKEKDLLNAGCSKDYINNMKEGLIHWINGGKQGYLNWGILLFQKK